MKILIVDDNDTNQYMLKSLLEGNGYEVVESVNGQEALDRLEKGDINLVVSDILMPVMDGFALCREVKKIGALQHIPIIIYTATYTGPQDEALALELGANRFIVKPCEPDVIISTIKEVMEESKNQNKTKTASTHTEEEILKLYNERLIRKLEQKMLQAETEVQARIDAMESLHRSETLLNATQNISKIGGWEWDVRKQEMYSTIETYLIHDIDPETAQLEGKDIIRLSIECYAEPDRKRIHEAFENCVNYGIPYDLECKFTTLKGRNLYIKTAGKPIFEGDKVVKVLGTIQDITERKQIEVEQIALREQLRQAQKLDSIGQLAGGVAHDFNNILAVILGYSEDILGRLKVEDPLYNDIEEIIKAGKKALSLTRQLLTFSRKHVVQPQIVNLNIIIKDLTKMLNRVLIEDIELSSALAENLSMIKVDPHQIEQVIINLAVNAREAMPNGGKLRIETSNVELIKSSTECQEGFAAGSYVLLSVSDTGCGMDKETLDRIFEPFFTTKHEAKGTGLGLSLVYGIIKQADGFIKVESFPCQGTTFKIYLPKTFECVVTQSIETNAIAVPGHGEHIVIVEDDSSLRILTKRMLVKLGYRVIMFDNAEEAIMGIESMNIKPDLIVTDVVMPGMNGKEMATMLSKSIPGLKVLFMSGYTDSVIIHHGIIENGIPFIQKPFTQDDIALQIRYLLDKEPKQINGNSSILMIDDDNEVLVIYKRLFSKKGYQLICKNNLNEALQALSKKPIKVILTDINIPGTDGLSIIKAIREAGFVTPAIVLSGDTGRINKDELEPLGIIGTFDKSNDIGLLIEEIEQIEYPS